MTMRFNYKLMVTLCCATVVFVSITLWTKCGDGNKEDNNFYRDVQDQTGPTDPEQVQKPGGVALKQLPEGVMEEDPGDAVQYTEIDCLINGEYTIRGRREDEDVYLPFNFIAKYFEVYGKIGTVNGGERFEWQHSYARVYPQKGKYKPDGVLMSFEHYNVEVRDRVKCISAMEGVPLSTQWGPQGYFYPIQIAQYGLSHYSKYLVEGEGPHIVVEDGRGEDHWQVLGGDAQVRGVAEPGTGEPVLYVYSPDNLRHPGVRLPVTVPSAFFLTLDFRFSRSSNGSITVVIEVAGQQKPYFIHYVCSNTLITTESNHVFYGLGDDRTRWSRITRDLVTDLQKGVYLHKKKKSKLVLKRIVSINVRGEGWIDNVTLSSHMHLAQFYQAADWMVKAQDSKGGWPIMVARKLVKGKLELEPGWYSAMAQGHGMSLLTRAYRMTLNQGYLEAALKAVHLYTVPSADGGIRTSFMDTHPWYEEYPTTPSSFVLNGFIYSLIGLYDLKESAPASDISQVIQLYQEGMESLKALLPMFDTGSGTIYDLRHVTIRVAPNLARWDYHATHVNQLLLLATVDKDPFLKRTAERWISYMKGHRAPHN